MGISFFNIVGGITEKILFRRLLSIIKFLCDFLILCYRMRRRKKGYGKNARKQKTLLRLVSALMLSEKKKLSKRCSTFPFSFKSMCCMIYELFNCFQKHYIFIKNEMNGCKIDMCVSWKSLAKSHPDEGSAFTQIAFTSSPSSHDVCSRNHRLLSKRKEGIKYVIYESHIFRV